MAEATDYRTSAPPSSLASACLLCGAEGDADRSCPTCSVPMPRSVCGCGVVNGVSAHACRACRAPLPEPVARQRACPRCATALTEIAIDTRASVHVCAGCRGLFVPPRAWLELLGRADLVDKLAARLPASASSAAPATKMFECPECDGQMERGRFAATSTIVIDACTRRDGLWLDAGELAPAISYAAHRRTISKEAAIAEAESRELRESGYDAAQVRSDLVDLERQNADTALAVANKLRNDHHPQTGWLPLVAVLALAALLYGAYCENSHRLHPSPPDAPAR